MRDDEGMRIPFGFIATVVGVVIVGVTVIFGSWYTVDQTARGVLLRNGATIGVAQPGLGFKMPLIDDVVKVAVTTRTFQWKKMDTYSFDQQQAFLDVSVTLHALPEKVDKLYATFGGLEAAVGQLLGPIVLQQAKIVFGQYTAVKAIQARAKLNSDLAEAIRAALGKTDVLTVSSVQLENIEFSKAYLESIEGRMLAEVEVQKLHQQEEQARVKATITVTNAKAQADATLARAKAEADAIKLKGEAEATAILARGKALGENPLLVALTQAEKWNGTLPTTMVPGGAVPMIGLGK